MEIDAQKVKDLRDKTGAGMMDCKKALVESSGDIDLAIDFLRKSGVTKAAKKSVRIVKEGLVYSYIHQGGRLGVLLDIGCETDFVAKTEGFKELAHDISMQIAATNPVALRREEVSADVVSRERSIYSDQEASSGKTMELINKIIEGKLNKYYQENCLLEQVFIKDSDRNIHEIINESIATLGENISVNRFVRFEIGEDA